MAIDVADKLCVWVQLESDFIDGIVNASRKLLAQFIPTKNLNDSSETIEWNQAQYIYQIGFHHISIAVLLQLIATLRTTLELMPKLDVYANCHLNIDLNCKTFLIQRRDLCLLEEKTDCPQLLQTPETVKSTESDKLLPILLAVGGVLVGTTAATFALLWPKRCQRHRRKTKRDDKLAFQK